MLNGKKIAIIMPAYNAEQTLEKTFNDIPKGIADEIILIDDNSSDNTFELSSNLGIKSYKHEKNMGYGANQKTCYKKALENNADIIIMLHPDFQYDPKLVPSIVSMIAYGKYDVTIASRFLSNSAKKSKMPRYKYFANKFLTWFQNLLLNQGLSEYHTGYRAFSSEVLKRIDFEKLNDDFIFDNEMLALIFYNNFKIGEISCPTRYFESASSINFKRSVKYGFGVLFISILYRLSKMGIKLGIFKNY